MAKKKDKKLQDFLKTAKKVNREARLARERLVGKARAKTFGGKPTAKDERRKWKKGKNLND